MQENKINEFDNILSDCGFEYGVTSKISYYHFKKYLERAKKLEGWDETRFLKSLRISIGIDLRYIKDIHEGFIELGIININNGCIEFLGLKKENNGKKKKIDRKEPVEQFKKLEEKTQLQKDRDKHNEFIEQKEVKNET